MSICLPHDSISKYPCRFPGNLILTPCLSIHSYMNWKQNFFYAYPPFSLIATCLPKIEMKNASGVIIVPLWKTQPWFTVLLHLLVAEHRLLLIGHVNGTSTQQCITPSATTSETDSMQSLRKSLEQRGLLQKVTEVILHSWSHGTIKQYEPYNIRRWIIFSKQRESNSFVRCELVFGIFEINFMRRS